MAKQGFKGQWIEIAKVGRVRDSKGIERDLTPDLLNSIVANFNAGQEAPLTIGHPKHAAPAYGWISQLRMNGDRLEMVAEDTADEFESMVQEGRFRTRSAGIWLTHPTLTSPTIDHVAFLGAEPPAVKGLRKIQFSESAEGESFDLEETINFKETEMKTEDLDNLPDGWLDKLKAKLGIGEKAELKEKPTDPASTAIQFSEADAKTLIAEAVTAVKTEFTDKITALEAENKELKEKVDGQISGSKRAEIAAFVEGIPADKGKHMLKRLHLVEFMESLAAADAADERGEEAICFSEGEGDDKTDYKSSRLDYMKNLIGILPPIVEFGEKFGNITATAEADAMITPGRAEELKKQMGVKKTGGEK